MPRKQSHEGLYFLRPAEHVFFSMVEKHKFTIKATCSRCCKSRPQETSTRTKYHLINRMY